jgi:hypothetical protein
MFNVMNFGAPEFMQMEFIAGCNCMCGCHCEENDTASVLCGAGTEAADGNEVAPHKE